MRLTQFVEGEYYHIFNRGVDKRKIFQDNQDFDRFLLSMVEFNSIELIGSIYEHSFKKKTQLGNSVSKLRKLEKPLVGIVAYCLNRNHFHFIVKQVAANGIGKFMHKLGLGFTKYFNERHKRSGSLFQGPFKAVHIESNEQLIHVSAYVNLNNLVHGFEDSKDFRSSWSEYMGKTEAGICQKEIITGQIQDIKEYKKLAEETVREIKSRRDLDKLILE